MSSETYPLPLHSQNNSSWHSKGVLQTCLSRNIPFVFPYELLTYPTALTNINVHEPKKKVSNATKPTPTRRYIVIDDMHLEEEEDQEQEEEDDEVIINEKQIVEEKEEKDNTNNDNNNNNKKEDDNDNEEIVIEKIISDRVQRNRGRWKKQFKIRWEGYGEDHDTWEDASSLTNAQDAIRDYWNVRNSKRKPKAVSVTHTSDGSKLFQDYEQFKNTNVSNVNADVKT
jgi:hypothetical protein